MDYDFDPYLDGPGKDAQIMIWRNGQAQQVRYRWGFKPVEPGGRPVSLLQSERWEITRPCLVMANDFGLKIEGKTKYRASLITKEPFFCLAGMWRPASPEWPASFAVFTVPAYPDIEPYKERHVCVVREDDWFPWLMQSKPKEAMIEPFPAGSFHIHGAHKQAAVSDFFG